MLKKTQSNINNILNITFTSKLLPKYWESATGHEEVHRSQPQNLICYKVSEIHNYSSLEALGNFRTVHENSLFITSAVTSRIDDSFFPFASDKLWK